MPADITPTLNTAQQAAVKAAKDGETFKDLARRQDVPQAEREARSDRMIDLDAISPAPAPKGQPSDLDAPAVLHGPGAVIELRIPHAAGGAREVARSEVAQCAVEEQGDAS